MVLAPVMVVMGSPDGGLRFCGESDEDGKW